MEKLPSSSSSSPALRFPWAQSPWGARGFCFPKPVRDWKGQAGRTLPRVGQRGSRFGVSASRVPYGSPGSGTAVVRAWTQKDLGPLCRRHTASGLGSPVTCCVQLQGPSPSRAMSGCVRTLPCWRLEPCLAPAHVPKGEFSGCALWAVSGTQELCSFPLSK